MDKLSVDPLAIAALVGFGSLVLIGVGLTVWIIRQSAKKPGELSGLPTGPAAMAVDSAPGVGA